MGKPFLATDQDLTALDTKNVKNQIVATSLSQIREVGQGQHEDYVTEN